MGYIEELREIVGHRPLILPGVGVGVINENEEILLQKNPDGKWGIPGGFMELGESAEETGRREVFEETGIEIGEMELVAVISGEETFTTLPNGDAYYSVTIIYASKDIKQGIPSPDGIETIDAKFFGLQELPGNLNPMIRNMIVSYSKSM